MIERFARQRERYERIASRLYVPWKAESVFGSKGPPRYVMQFVDEIEGRRTLPDSVAEAVVAMDSFGRAAVEASRIFGRWGFNEDLRRQAKVLRQRQAGLTGGGPKCPNCGKREFYRMEHDDRLQCRGCRIGARVVVKAGRIVLRIVAVPGAPPPMLPRRPVFVGPR